jgi:hypothetical protein
MAQRYGRGGRVIVCLGVALALVGLSRGAAQAQTKLLKPAGGGTLKITKSGSYFLGANYASSLKGAPVIVINVNNVTINLNGFTLSGTGGSGTAVGINAQGDSGVSILNGTITSIPGKAIVLGSNSVVSGVNLIGNSGDGVDCTANCLVVGDIVSGNTGVGLNFADGSSGYQNNILSSNSTNVASGTNLGHNVCGVALCPP